MSIYYMDKDISYYRYKARKYKNKLKNLRQWAGAKAKAKTEGEAKTEGNTTHDNLTHAEAKSMCDGYDNDDSVTRVYMGRDPLNEGRYVVSVSRDPYDTDEDED